MANIDALSSRAELVANQQAEEKKVIAYLSVGSVENFRPGAGQFPEAIIRKIYVGFENENWLDIRNIDALAPILRGRLDMIKDKGFDSVEPDNIDGYENETGFPLNGNDALAFCVWLINESHDRGLSIGQKNGPELVPFLADHMDWMLTESAYVNCWYESTFPYLENNKAVFFTEYLEKILEQQFYDLVCPIAIEKGLSAIISNIALNDDSSSCN